MEASHIIWVDGQINSESNTKYKIQLELLGNFKIKYFLDVNEAMTYIKSIKYEETFIIVSGRLHTDLIGNLIKNFTDLCIIPKIIVFTSKHGKDGVAQKSKELNNWQYYHFGGIVAGFEPIKEFILKSSKKDDISFNEENMNFEPINDKEKLILPLLYKMLIRITPNDNIKKLNEELNNIYGEKNKEMKKLFNLIKNIDNIPLELLSKYYSKIFNYDDNLQLKENSNEYLTFIKVLYEGIKLKSLPLTSNNVLYRGMFCTKELIDEVKKANKNNKDLPRAILFT